MVAAAGLAWSTVEVFRVLGLVCRGVRLALELSQRTWVVFSCARTRGWDTRRRCDRDGGSYVSAARFCFPDCQRRFFLVFFVRSLLSSMFLFVHYAGENIASFTLGPLRERCIREKNRFVLRLQAATLTMYPYLVIEIEITSNASQKCLCRNEIIWKIKYYIFYLILLIENSMFLFTVTLSLWSR